MSGRFISMESPSEMEQIRIDLKHDLSDAIWKLIKEHAARGNCFEWHVTYKAKNGRKVRLEE